MSAAVVLAAMVPTATLATWEDQASDFARLGRPDPYQRQAFTLEEMNCFSSDIHARDPIAADPGAPGDGRAMRLASGSSGTNGIPCNPRDPKAPPKRKRSQS
jgi:hypothetical protein